MIRVGGLLLQFLQHVLPPASVAYFAINNQNPWPLSFFLAKEVRKPEAAERPQPLSQRGAGGNLRHSS